MKTTSIMLISVLLATPVAAQHSTAVVLSEGVAQATVDAEVIRLREERAKAYVHRTCADEDLPHDMGAHCFNAVTGVRPGSPVGASEGGE